MKVDSIALNKVKSFDGLVIASFDDDASMFSLSGKNGSGKSTILKSIWLAQKAYFCRLLNDEGRWKEFELEALRFLHTNDSYIKLTMAEDEHRTVLTLKNEKKSVTLTVSDEFLIEKYWNLKSPSHLVLYVDASKGFSEETLSFNEIDIAENTRGALALEAIFRPEMLFTGIYRQLVKDYVHGRLIPSKPDQLLYFRLASKMFTTLIPAVELRNFSGKHKHGEFVLLGKANADKRKPLYDVREFSSGEKALLSTLVFLCMSRSVSALIIDEPENHFHEGLLLEFVAFLYGLCEGGGLLGWAGAAKSSGALNNLKEDWLKHEYKDHNLNQVIVSTHSKTLIYKFFSIGRNFIVDDGVHELGYEEAETKLRELGLSSIYNNVILVEGAGDHEALEYAITGRNIKLKPLNGSLDVVDTFKRLAVIREYVRDMRFVFLVDSDNKPENYFSEIRAIDEDFYDSVFIRLEKHEFENYFLDPELISSTVNSYLDLKGDAASKVDSDQVRTKLVELAKSSLPQVYKKELSLSFQHTIGSFFSERIWGDKDFDWSDGIKVRTQIQQNVLDSSNVAQLINILSEATSAVYSAYSNPVEPSLIDRCDGKQVLGKAVSVFSKLAGADRKSFKQALYKKAFSSSTSHAAVLVQRILARFN